MDFKVLTYQESDDRIRVVAPAALLERDLSSTVTLKVEGIYNSISGASPTGEPPRPRTRTVTVTEQIRVSAPSTVTTVPGGDDDSRDNDDDERGGLIYAGISGATAQASSSSSSSSSSSRTVTRSSEVPIPGSFIIPTAEIEDTRIGLNLELSKRLEQSILTGQAAFSTENDYTSLAGALKWTREFNQKNTSLQAGLAYAHDLVDVFTQDRSDSKDSIDLLLGVTQLLDPKTLFTANATLGYTTGYLADPYKIAEVDGQLRPESRPDTRDRQILYLSLTRYLETLNGSLEPAYRYYTDSFGIAAHTLLLSWYQKVGSRLVVRPSVRYYEQGAADFYGVRFTGAPTYYSADYRLSDLTSLSLGIKLIWFPSSSVSFDVAYDRYEMEGKDGETLAEVYPSADVLTFGARLWF